MKENEKQKILIVSHCFLNDAAKLRNQEENAQAEERLSKRVFLKKMLTDGVELIQLPCPEFLLYGSNRWGHAASQFDTPYFRKEARAMLTPIILQLQEYAKYPNRFEILGILGIDGSPSCGVNYTYDGDWGGELTNGTDLKNTLNNLKKVQKPGIFMSVFKEMLLEHHLPMNIYSLESYPEKVSNSTYDFLGIPIGGSNRQKPLPTQAKSQFALKREAIKKGKSLNLI